MMTGSLPASEVASSAGLLNGTIYVWHRDTLAKGLWSGRTRLHEMPHERSVDIDSEIDFKLVELLMGEAREKDRTDG